MPCTWRCGETVIRDMFYDGHPVAEPGAVVCRVAPSFTRFGHFELLAARGDRALLQRLVAFTLARDFPERVAAGTANDLAAWFREICERTARLMVHWMRVGFVHGVMNTDNMSILGLTIDYGPYGWLEPFDPQWTPNTTDFEGRRYAYGQQPQIGQWNLSALAGALVTLFPDQAPLHEGLKRYASVFATEHARLTAARFGWPALGELELELAQDFFRLLQRDEVDVTLVFRHLADLDLAAPQVDTLAAAFYAPDRIAKGAADWDAWLQAYATRSLSDPRPASERIAAMNATNPLYVPRNYLAQLAIDAAEQGDVGVLQLWMDTLRQPYRVQPGRERFAARRPEWARERAGCSMLSCSS